MDTFDAGWEPLDSLVEDARNADMADEEGRAEAEEAEAEESAEAGVALGLERRKCILNHLTGR